MIKPPTISQAGGPAMHQLPMRCERKEFEATRIMPRGRLVSIMSCLAYFNMKLTFSGDRGRQRRLRDGARGRS